MKSYKQITFNESEVPHKEIRGIKIAIQNKRLREGTYKCYCPSGNIHTWEISNDRQHVCSGTAKKKIKVGKGVIKLHYVAKLKSVKQS